MAQRPSADSGVRPSLDEIREALGSQYPLWERLTGFVEDTYKIEGKWSTWGPSGSGWGLRYRVKGRSLVALYPHTEMVTAQVVLGKAQADRALSLELGEKVSRMLKETPQLRDGRWLHIPVISGADAEDVERLLLAKMRPRVRRKQTGGTL